MLFDLGKIEVWYVLVVELDSKIYVGFKEGID